VFKAMVSVLERSMGDGVRGRETVAQATAALCVGGMVVARAMEDRRTADGLRDACMAVALEHGGWGSWNKANGGKGKRAELHSAALR